VDPFSTMSYDELVNQLLANSQDVFVVTQPLVTNDGIARLQYVSPSVTHVLGWYPEQLVGNVCLILLHPDDLAPQVSATGVAMSSDLKAFYGMRRMMHADGLFRWMHVHVWRCQHADGSEYLSAIWRDASSFKESQTALSDFLMATSHDLRTPISGILAAAQVLETHEAVRCDPEAAFLVQTVRQCGTLMLSVVSNILEMRTLGLTNLDAADEVVEAENTLTVKLNPVIFRPRELVKDTMDSWCGALGMSSSEICFIDDCPATGPHVFVADVTRLGRIVQNVLFALLHHATTAAALEIRLGCVPLSDTCTELQLDASDSKREIAASALELMFTPYDFSEHPDGAHNTLALCIARAYSRLLGGSLLAEQKTGSGVVIRLRVPMAMASAQLQGQVETPSEAPLPNTWRPPPFRAPTAASGARKRVFIVEDHAMNLMLLTRILTKAGFEIESAVNGAEALEKLQAMPQLPSALLTDIQMPVMDGLQFARCFREWEAATMPGMRLPIWALSANVMAESVNECLSAGIDRHCAKPLRPDAIAALKQLLDNID
jgi:PAS domain S-box-containing protein